MTIRTDPSGSKRVEYPVPLDAQDKLGVTKLSRVIPKGSTPEAVLDELRDIVDYARGPKPVKITIELTTIRDREHLASLEAALKACLKEFPRSLVTISRQHSTRK
jgi:hypothetical protein